MSVAHRHPGCTERFEVLEGELTVQLDGQTRTLTAGEQVTIAPGAAHHYANTSDEDVVFRFDVWPAARFEAMVVTLCARDRGQDGRQRRAVAAADGGPPRRVRRRPRARRAAALAAASGDKVLARIGRARGLRASYPITTRCTRAGSSGPAPPSRSGPVMTRASLAVLALALAVRP